MVVTACAALNWQLVGLCPLLWHLLCNIFINRYRITGIA